MRQWCALLENEVQSWPGVHAKPMFGMLAFYRQGRIFAAVPRTRSPGKSNAVIFKLQGASERLSSAALNHPKVTTGFLPKAGWIAMELDSVDDVRETLRWFSQAYELAGEKKKQVPHRQSGSG